VTDYYLVVSGSSAPHLRALADEVQYTLKKEGITAHRRQGNPESGWIVVDYFDVVIHIFAAQTRQYYAIEELWAGARRPRR
jgi:ribosome-associated protein